MKKSLLIVSGLVLLTFSACKKGENDPSLSLSTRKARLAGEYTIDAWLNLYTYVYSNGDVEEVNVDIDGTTGSRENTYTPGGGGTSTTTTYDITIQKATFTFDKEGTWSMIVNKTTKWITNGGGFLVDYEAYTQIETLTESGAWVFLPGQGDDFKNKERVMLSVLNSVSSSQLNQVTHFIDASTFASNGSVEGRNYTYANGEESVVYEIDRLAGKEMIFVQDNEGKDIYTSTDGGVTYTTTITQLGSSEIRLSEN